MFGYLFSCKKCFWSLKCSSSYCLSFVYPSKAFLLENCILLFQELFGAIGALCSAKLVNIGTAECVYENAEDAFAAYTKYHTRNLDGRFAFNQVICLNLVAADVLTQYVRQLETAFKIQCLQCAQLDSRTQPCSKTTWWPLGRNGNSPVSSVFFMLSTQF